MYIYYPDQVTMVNLFVTKMHLVHTCKCMRWQLGRCNERHCEFVVLMWVEI